MEDYRLLVDLHRDGYRQGPGGDSETELAIRLSRLDEKEKLRILDIGCGTGASTIVLASLLDCQITAIDIFDEFLTEVGHRAKEKGLENQIETLKCTMDDLPFAIEEFDAIWGEGAIYNMGFSKGVSYLRDFLKPEGILAVSEMTWFSSKRPKELEVHWNEEYSEMATTSAKIKVLESSGFSIQGYFPLPNKCWKKNYYDAMSARFDDFLMRNEDSEDAKAIVAAEKQEMRLHDQYHRFYGYGFYIAKKL